MAIYTVQSNQNIFDVALHLYGSIEGVFDLLITNDWLNMNRELIQGDKLEYHEDFIVNQQIIDDLKKEDVVPANGERHVYFKETDEQLAVIIDVPITQESMHFKVRGYNNMIIDWGDNTDLEHILLKNSSYTIVEHWFNSKVENRRVKIYGDFALISWDVSGMGGLIRPTVAISVNEFVAKSNNSSLIGLFLFENTRKVDLRNSQISSLMPLADTHLEDLDLRGVSYAHNNVLDEYLLYISDDETYNGREGCVVRLTGTVSETGRSCIEKLLGKNNEINRPWEFLFYESEIEDMDESQLAKTPLRPLSEISGEESVLFTEENSVGRIRLNALRSYIASDMQSSIDNVERQVNNLVDTVSGEISERQRADLNLANRIINIENSIIGNADNDSTITGDEFTFNGYLNYQGELKSHTDYKATDYIDVHDARTISGDFTALSAAHYICYTQDKTLIMAYHHESEGPVNLPDGTAYIRFCHDFTQGEPSITINRKNAASSGGLNMLVDSALDETSDNPIANRAVATKIAELEDSDRAIMESLGIINVTAADFGMVGYLNAAGELKPHADYKATDYINTRGAESASGNFTALVAAHYICYNADKALIMAYHHEGDGAVNLPVGTAYIRFCHDFTNGGEPSITISKGLGANITVDAVLDSSSFNPIANSVVASKIAELEHTVKTTLGITNIGASDFILNGYLNYQGELKSHADYKTTDFIDIVGVKSASGNFTALVSAHYICYTENKTLIMAYHHEGEGPMIIPDGTAYIRICHDFTQGEPSIIIDRGQSSSSNGNITYRTQVRRPMDFAGKSAVFVGDSITRGFVNGGTITENGWPKLFSEAAGMTFTNIAVGGASFLDGTVADNILVQVTRADKTADFIFIAAGVNDWQLDLSYDDFKARVEAVCDYLNANYAGKVVWITPIAAPRCLMATQPTRSLQRYRDIITETVLRKDTLSRFSVVQGTDLNFPITYGTEQCAAFFGDGLHPNEYGYKQYTAALTGVLI